MSAVISGAGRMPKDMPLAALLPMLAELEPFADRHDATLYVECSRDVIEISARTVTGIVCLECGCGLKKRIAKTTRLDKAHRNRGAVVMIHFCDIHPTAGAK